MFSQYPKQISYIVGNEACERFSYYGMRSILVVFMVHNLAMPEHEAKGVYHLFMTGCYFLTIMGGYIADRFLGKYRTILYFSLIYCLGHGVLALGESKELLYIGLTLISFGVGGVKPTVSTHVGDQFHEGNKHLLEKIFEIFYWMINVGAFASSFLIPIILPRYGAQWAFGIPGILMALSTLIFWMGRKHYVYVPPSGKEGSAHFFSIVLYALTHLGSRKPGESWLDTAKAKYGTERVEGAKSAIDVFKVFFFVSAFWALYDQQGSTWVLQAERMNRNFLGFNVESSHVNAINPILILAMIPLFSLGIYPFLRRIGFQMTALQKMTAGMWVTFLSFLSVAAIEIAMQKTTLNIGWVLIPSVLITAAEILVSITGLEFAYTQAPRSMKSTIMSLWFLTISAGNFFTAVFSYLNPFSRENELYFYAGMMAIVAFIFSWVAKRYRERDYVEAEGAGLRH